MKPRLNIIHLFDGSPHADDRMWNIQRQLQSQNISDYKIWAGVEDRKNPSTGINQAHKLVVRKARENNLTEICICEDDIVFNEPTSFETFLDNKPNQFDLYLGGCSNRLRQEGNRIYDFRGLTIYFIHERFYDTFLGVSDNYHIDALMKDLGEFYVCPENICSQMPGYSYNRKRFMDYSRHFK
jgi:hypothetical protein